MENSQKNKIRIANKRALRIRKGVRGSTEKPRLSVMRSNTSVYVQLIDDDKSLTVASTSTRSKDFRNSEFNKCNQASAKQLGLKIAALAQEKKVKKVVFDRGARKYHGVVAAVADGAREGGLEF